MLICVDKRSAPGQSLICVQGVESQEASRKWSCFLCASVVNIAQ